MTFADHPRWQNFSLPLFLLVSAVYCGIILREAWIPQDEGVLAQTAERTLDGQFPHRDFDEPYSGGLTWLNASAFRIWGIRLVSMRIPLLCFYLLFLAALYVLARRWLTPAYAGLFGLTCLGWGLPAYFAALPSWYLSFFAGYGTFFLMKHAESGQKRWLFAAGIIGGISMCFKILGIYFVMAGVVFLMYRECILARSEPGTINSPPHHFLTLVLKSLIAVLIFSCLTAVLWKRLGLKEFIHFLLPGALLMAVPAALDFSPRNKASGARLPRLLSLELSFLGGVAVPLTLFVLAFWKAHALSALWTGLFILPQRRYAFAFYALPPAWTTLTVLPIAILFWRCSLRRPDIPVWHEALLSAAMLFFALGGMKPQIYHAVWFTLRPLVPLLAIVGTLWLTDSKVATRLSELQRQRLSLVLTVMAFVSLIQFPDSFGGYFFYTAPFVALAGMAMFQSCAKRLRNLGTSVMLAYGVFGFLWVARGEPGLAGELYVPRMISETLLPERADLKIGKREYWMYETLVREIQVRSAGADYIYAGPDCPEVYFLSGKKNPTRIFYEFFVPEHETTEIILKAIHDGNVKVVVLNARPGFSRRVSKELYLAIAQRFPNHDDIDKFRLFW